MVWLTLAWKFLRGIPREVWVLLVFLAAVAFAVGYHQHAKREAFKAGEAARQVLWDEAVARGKEEIARLDRENAANEAKAFADGQAVGEKRIRDQSDQIKARDQLIADQRNGIVQLRKHWQGCVREAQARDDAAMPSGPVSADELRATGAADLVRIGQDADSRHARLVEFVQVQQKLCEAVAGP